MALSSAKQWFITRAVLVFALIFIALTLFGIAADLAMSRFGGLIWFALLPGVISVAFGLACAWVSISDWRDWRALKVSGISPGQPLPNGDTIAISGRITTNGPGLTSPLFKQPCAGYSLRINGQRRSRSDSGSGYRSQLCVLEFGLSDARLDTGTQALRLLALPDVDIAFRNTAQGGEVGRQAMKHIKRVHLEGETQGEADAEARLIAAGARMLPPAHHRLFIANTQTTSNHMSVIEDIVPVDRQVTVLANFQALRDELNGDRRGGMKIFDGPLDECVKKVRKEWLQTGTLSIPALIGGMALVTCGYWWPS